MLTFLQKWILSHPQKVCIGEVAPVFGAKIQNRVALYLKWFTFSILFSEFLSEYEVWHILSVFAIILIYIFLNKGKVGSKVYYISV